MNTPNEEYFKNPIINPKYLNKNYPELYNFLINNYPKNLSISEKLYWWRYKIDTHPLCPVCGKALKYINFKHGYQHYCSYKCAGSSEVRKIQIENTCLKRYGVKNPKQNQEVNRKAEKTCLERYGVKNPSQSDKIKEKIIETNKSRYGVEYIGQSDEIKDKIKNTLEYKYGVESALKLPQTSINRDIARKNKMRKYDGYMDTDFNEDIYIFQCPHPNCNKCEERYYKIPRSAYFDRRRDRTEPCTHLLPFKNHEKNSGIEKEIHIILDEIGIEYEVNNWNIIKPKELDIYIPSKKIAIECNGVFCHCSKYKDYKYHINKTLICNDLGIRLLHIWEDWIKDKYDIVKSMILSKFGIYKDRIYARKCIVKEIESKICNEFLENNHIQGKSNSTTKLGLYYNDELVSVMTFGRQSAGSGGKNKEIELKRFCTKLNTQVIGGASKLFNYYVRHYNPNKVISYACNDISDGNVYDKLGFKSDGVITGSYWWVKKGTYKRYHRYCFSKRDIVRLGWKDKVDDSWTEDDVMYSKGFVKIYDSGKIKWVWNKNDEMFE